MSQYVTSIWRTTIFYTFFLSVREYLNVEHIRCTRVCKFTYLHLKTKATRMPKIRHVSVSTFGSNVDVTHRDIFFPSKRISRSARFTTTITLELLLFSASLLLFNTSTPASNYIGTYRAWPTEWSCGEPSFHLVALSSYSELREVIGERTSNRPAGSSYDSVWCWTLRYQPWDAFGTRGRIGSQGRR